MKNTSKKRVTLNDIATLSGLSTTTVSMILNGRGEEFKIKAETCQRVKAIAQAEGYRVNIYAKSLKTQRSNVIGLVIPDLTNYGFAYTAKMLEKQCHENGLQLVIACSDDNPQQEKLATERLLDRQIDFLITAPTHQDPYYYQQIAQQTPILQLDRYVPNLDLRYIISNDSDKIAELVQYLAQKYQPKEFVYFGGQFALSPSESRLQGFLTGLAQAHIPPQNDWILHRTYQPESGYQMLAEVKQRLGRLPEAIFTASYTLLEGVLRYLTEHQQMDHLLNRQLHLATFDNHDLLNALPFHIHSIKQNHQVIAQQAFATVQQILHGEQTSNIKIDCEIIYRN
ncbi:substrate-binding domain-containing protein [Pasteurella oralis]|uniref:Substrate-binding domain-containing protein n=1 Tax=Pasteurella oralis TaxID=1071947 RepID=A0ABW4NTI4_9PAST